MTIDFGFAAAPRGVRRAWAATAAAVLLGMAPGLASAGLMTSTDSGRLRNADGGSITLHRFDPSLGTLASVTLEAGFYALASGNVAHSAAGANSSFWLGDIHLYLTSSAICCGSAMKVTDRRSQTSTDPDTLALFTAGPDTFEIKFTTWTNQLSLAGFTADAQVTYKYDAAAVPEPASAGLGVGQWRRRGAAGDGAAR